MNFKIDCIVMGLPDRPKPYMNGEECFYCGSDRNLHHCDNCHQALYCSDHCYFKHQKSHSVTCSYLTKGLEVELEEPFPNEIPVQLNKMIDFIIAHPLKESCGSEIFYAMKNIINLCQNRISTSVPGINLKVLYSNDICIQCILCHNATSDYHQQHDNSNQYIDIMDEIPYIGLGHSKSYEDYLPETMILKFLRGNETVIYAPLCKHCYDRAYLPNDKLNMLCTTHLTPHYTCIGKEKEKLRPLFYNFLLCIRRSSIVLPKDIRNYLWELVTYDACNQCIIQSDDDYGKEFEYRTVKQYSMQQVRGLFGENE